MMSSLSDKRLDRLHTQFVDAAERFPTFHFAAVCEIVNPDWPQVAVNKDWRLGLSPDVWRNILRKPARQQFAPDDDTVWLRIDGRLWEGGYFDDGKPWDDVLEQLHHVQEARNVFERLADQAAGNFTLPLNNPDGEFPLETKPAHRWLECVCAMPFVEVEFRQSDTHRLVRNVLGDIFTASARAVEILDKEQSAPRQPAVAKAAGFVSDKREPTSKRETCGAELGVMGGTVTAQQKRFRVALSFPGERRAFVEQVAGCLAESLGRERVLYDKYYEAEFARIDLNTHLQQLYHEQSELIAVFLCAEYERKEWCGLEWRAILDLIKRRQASTVMSLRFDDTEIPGLFSTDGYVSIGDRTPEDIANLILQRLRSGGTL
jgi:hypothetical protein